MKPRHKPEREGEVREVYYDEERWRILEEKREVAREILRALRKNGIDAIAHGSIARGDVSRDSDVDIFIPMVIPSYIVELSLDEFGILRREIVQATPWHLPKGHLELGNGALVVFPLMKPKQVELDFYYFGGAVGLDEIERGVRVPGVDKRLMLIQPTDFGHVESSIIGREEEVARILNVSLEVVRERVQVLTRRDEVGRTGVFLKRELLPHESFESVLRELVDRMPELKRRLRESG